MHIIGITGPTGCGKTTLLRVIEAHGGFAVDCDPAEQADWLRGCCEDR